MKHLLIAAATVALTGPAFADGHASGDAEAGAAAFNRQCVACHVVADADGEILAGRKARTGPNLYAIAGRPIGSVDGFRYGKSIVKLGKDGIVWDEEKFVGYVQDPTGWLKETLDDKKARGKMAFKVRKEADAADIYAYLVSLAPAETN
ncbi:MAG: cytochrome c family protein [Sedimentitalea sp.]